MSCSRLLRSQKSQEPSSRGERPRTQLPAGAHDLTCTHRRARARHGRRRDGRSRGPAAGCSAARRDQHACRLVRRTRRDAVHCCGGSSGITLATWNQLVDSGSLQDGEPFLAATCRPAVAYISQHTADAVGVITGEAVRVATDAGVVEVPAVVTLMADSTVWLPTNNEGSHVRADLHAAHGTQVTITRGGAA